MQNAPETETRSKQIIMIKKKKTLQGTNIFEHEWKLQNVELKA